MSSHSDAVKRHKAAVAKHARKPKRVKIHARKVKLVGLTTVKRNAATLGKSQRGAKASVRRRK